MPSSTGLSNVSGAALSDWDHTQQSIQTILLTPIGSRVMRRDFGCEIHSLIDSKMTARNILAVYSACASAIARWEPRFRMRRGRLQALGPNGRVVLTLIGTYFPRGHLGDYTVAEDRTTRLVLDAT